MESVIYEKITFPCGYTWESKGKYKSFIMTLEPTFKRGLPVCPIHGIKCKKQND